MSQIFVSVYYYMLVILLIISKQDMIGENTNGF